HARPHTHIHRSRRSRVPGHRLPYLWRIPLFHHPGPPEIYTLSLHDALPISPILGDPAAAGRADGAHAFRAVASHPGEDDAETLRDRKSTRLNSSHDQISYAVFCLKKKTRTLPRSGMQWISNKSSMQIAEYVV